MTDRFDPQSVDVSPTAGPQPGEPWPSRGEAWLVFDRDCPFCERYTVYLRLQETMTGLRLIDAREGGAVVAMLWKRGLDLNQGFVLLLGEQCFYGADCLHALALLSTRSAWLNRFHHALFRHRRVANVAYPVLRAGRHVALTLMRRQPLKAT